MKEYAKIHITESMKNDFNECCQMCDQGVEKDCNGCECNGGENFECVNANCYEVDPEQVEQLAMHYGFEAQSNQAIEEMAEFTIALNKYKRNLVTYQKEGKVCYRLDENVVEEIADVELMIHQIKILLGIDQKGIEVVKEMKVNRQLERIRGQNGESTKVSR